MYKYRETEFQLVVECRIPGGKVERAGKREGERKTQVLTSRWREREIRRGEERR